MNHGLGGIGIDLFFSIYRPPGTTPITWHITRHIIRTHHNACAPVTSTHQCEPSSATLRLLPGTPDIHAHILENGSQIPGKCDEAVMIRLVSGSEIVIYLCESSALSHLRRESHKVEDRSRQREASDATETERTDCLERIKWGGWIRDDAGVEENPPPTHSDMLRWRACTAPERPPRA